MKHLALLCFLLCGLATPAHAQSLRESIIEFCETIRTKPNAEGFSGAPGSLMAQDVFRATGVTPERYRYLWALAKLVQDPSCAAMW